MIRARVRASKFRTQIVVCGNCKNMLNASEIIKQTHIIISFHVTLSLGTPPMPEQSFFDIFDLNILFFNGKKKKNEITSAME